MAWSALPGWLASRGDAGLLGVRPLGEAATIARSDWERLLGALVAPRELPRERQEALDELGPGPLVAVLEIALEEDPVLPRALGRCLRALVAQRRPRHDSPARSPHAG